MDIQIHTCTHACTHMVCVCKYVRMRVCMHGCTLSHMRGYTRMDTCSMQYTCLLDLNNWMHMYINNACCSMHTSGSIRISTMSFTKYPTENATVQRIQSFKSVKRKKRRIGVPARQSEPKTWSYKRKLKLFVVQAFMCMMVVCVFVYMRVLRA